MQAAFTHRPGGHGLHLVLPEGDHGHGDERGQEEAGSKSSFHAFNVSQKVQTGKYWRLCDGSPSQGELKGVYSRNQFEPLPHPLLSVSDVVRDVELPLRTAANKQSQGGGQGFVKCGCVKTCQANNCKCKKANQFCNSRCHKGSNSCLNHE